jgi:hypothetical protein
MMMMMVCMLYDHIQRKSFKRFADIYGPSTRPVQPSGSTITKILRSVVRLSLCDNVQAYGTISDISFS